MVLSDSKKKNLRHKGGNIKMILKILGTRTCYFLQQQEVDASKGGNNEDISPNTLEAAKTLSRVASLKPKSIDKGRRYKRRKETKGKKVVSSLDFQEEVDTGAEQVNTAEGVNTGSIKLSTVSEQVSTGNEQVSTVSAKKSTSSPDKGQREGKAPMISEETPKKSKEQILQEEASLAEAIRLDSLQKEEEAKQIHLDSLLAQRIAEEEELNEQQKKRKAQVQFEAQHYTDEDWDLIRAKIEANAELSKSMLGSDLQGEDFAKKMVDLVNQRKKYFAEERARAKRNKPMTQSQLKTYMMNYLKNQGTWKLSQLKNLSFEEVKKEFDKLVKQDDEPTKKSGKRRKQMARRGLHTDLDKDDSEGSDEVGKQEESVTGTKTPINPVPVAMKSPSIVTYKIIKQGEKGVYQIISRMDGPEDELEKVPKDWTSPEQTATGKGISNPFMAVMVCQKPYGIQLTKVSHFTSKLLNLDNTPPRLDETSSQTSSPFTILVRAIPEITSATTVPLPHPFFNPVQQEATPTPTPTTSEATTSTLALPDFGCVFRFNKKVTNLAKYLSEMKHVDQYATSLSSIPAIVDRYIENKLGKAINKAIQAHNLDYRQEAQVEDKYQTSSSKLTTVPVSTEEPTRKSKRVKRLAKKSTKAPARGVVIQETLEMPLSKKKEKTHPSGYGAAKIIPSVTSKGTGVKPRVPDVTEEESSKNNENESDSEHKADENESGSEYDQEVNEEDEDDEEEVKDKLIKTPSNDSDDEDETKITDKAEGDEDEEMDYTTKEGTDAVMTNVQHGNENPEIIQVIKDAHVTLSTVPQKTEVLVISSSHSSDLATKFLNFLDIPHTDAENFFPMDVHVHHEVLSQVTTLEKEVAELKKDPLHTQVIALVDDHLDTRLGATREEFMNFLSVSLTTRIIEQVKNQLPQILPEEVSNFAPLVIPKMVQESLEDDVLAKESFQP
ncbi:hypothetical protein Tco_0085740 [Tanacetum coccineum]